MRGSRSRIRLLLAGFGLILALCPGVAGSGAPARRPAETALLIVRADRVLPVGAPPIAPGVVVIRRGRIAAVGRDLPARGGVHPEGTRLRALPPGARVLRARVAMPGMVDPHSYLGAYADREEPVDAITPEFRAADGFDAADPALGRARRAGVTSAGLAPGNGNPIGGQVAVLRLTDPPAVRAASVALKFSISEDATSSQRNPTSRAGLLDLVRAALDGAGGERGVSGNVQTSLMMGFSSRLEARPRALRRAARGALPVLIHAPAADDVENALDLVSEFGLKAALVHSHEAVEQARRLKHGGIPVVFGPLGLGAPQKVLAAPARLDRAGVKIAFCTDAPLSDPASLRMSAHLAVRHGLSPAAALRALTLHPAGILGLADRIGSLAPGRQADLLLLDGDPLDLTSRVTGVIVGGRVLE